MLKADLHVHNVKLQGIVCDMVAFTNIANRRYSYTA